MTDAIDFDEALRRCFGRLALFERVRATFLDLQQDMPRRVAQALAAGDATAAAEETHRMMSNAGTLGAVRLAAVCAHIDTMLREGRLADAAAQLPLLQSAHADACEALQRLARPAPSDAGQGGAP